MTARTYGTAEVAATRVRTHRRRITPSRVALYGFLTFMGITWLFPLAWAVLTSLRPYSETLANGYISVTPLQIDLTRHGLIGDVGDWLQGKGQ